MNFSNQRLILCILSQGLLLLGLGKILLVFNKNYVNIFFFNFLT